MTAYTTTFIKNDAVQAMANVHDLVLLENTIDFSDNNLTSGDTVRLFEFDGLHVLKVMWEVKPCSGAATITLGDSADANDWSNNTDITCSTTADAVGLSTANNGVGKSYAEDAANYLLMTTGTANLTSGSITVKVLAVRM